MNTKNSDTEFILILITLFASGIQAATIPSTNGNESLTGAKPIVTPAFTQLPLGAVEPRRWILDWARASREGIAGHLDEYNPTFADGWKGISIVTRGAQPDGLGWPIEQCGNWLDGALRLGIILHDQSLIDKIAGRLDPVVNGTLAGSSTLIYWKDRSVIMPANTDPRENRNQNFNSWAHAQMARALLAYYNYKHDRRILDALTKAYNGYPMANLSDDFSTTNGPDGTVNIEPMLDVYALTGDKHVLDSALRITRLPDFRNTCERKWSELAEHGGSGHAAGFDEIARIPAILYPWTGRRWMLDATLRAYNWVEAVHMLPEGVHSGEECLAGVGSFRLMETCDIPFWIWSQETLLRIQGMAIRGDKIERAFFNAAPAPIARDWKTISYYHSPNRISPDLPGANPSPDAKSPHYQMEFARLGSDVLCCVANSTRIIPFYISDMWLATADGGLAAAIYGPCGVTAEVSNHNKVKLICDTDYPFEETIRVRVYPERSAIFPLYFRVPQWCSNPQIKTGLFFNRIHPDANGFVRVARTWKKGDIVTLRFPMEVAVAYGRETPYPQIKYFRRNGSKQKDVKNPFATISYGPLLFALPIPDVNANIPCEGGKWQYALDFDGKRKGMEAREIKVERHEMPSTWYWQLDAPLTLTIPAKTFDWRPTDLQPLPAEPVTSNALQERIRLVPYGCAKFRVSMFPVTERAWATLN